VNVWGAVILGALLLEFALERTADALNFRALRPGLPPEVRGVYDADRYRRAQEYTRARIHFGVVGATADLLVLLAFWFAGGFAWLDRAMRALGLGSIATGLLFVGSLGAGRALLALPFRWWSTFVIEERFGFNRTTRWTFWTDLAKGLVLAATLGGPLLAAILWLLERAGGTAWLWCWLATALFVVGVEYVAPTWILPLFNRFRPLDAGTLRDAILDYARAVGFAAEGVFVIDGSRRSTKANAFLTGFGRRKRIALFDTLLGILQPGEVVAVVAHEVGHWEHRHVLQGTLVGVLHAGLIFLLLSVALERRGLFEAFFLEQPSAWAGLVLFALVLAPLELGLSLALHALSRRHEREADAFAARTTGSGERLAGALVRLSADSLANLTPHPLYVALHYSHPPVLDRVRRLRRSATG
jgi:STE24 endopeptidase